MKNLKKIRLERGMTQGEIADAIGMSVTAVCYYETGAREPNLETLRKLAKVLECTIDELIGKDEDDGAGKETNDEGTV